MISHTQNYMDGQQKNALSNQIHTYSTPYYNSPILHPFMLQSLQATHQQTLSPRRTHETSCHTRSHCILVVNHYPSITVHIAGEHGIQHEENVTCSNLRLVQSLALTRFPRAGNTGPQIPATRTRIVVYISTAMTRNSGAWRKKCEVCGR